MQEISASPTPRPSVTRVSDAQRDRVLLRHPQEEPGLRPPRWSSKGLLDGAAAARAGTCSKVCLSFIGYEGGKSHVAREKKLVKDIVGKHGGIVVGTGPGRALRPEEVRHPVHPRLPARPRRGRRRLGDRRAVVEAACRCTTTSSRPANKAYAQLGVDGLDHVPPVALVPLGRLPVLHLRVPARRRRPAGRSTTGQVARSSRRSSTTAAPCRTTTRSAPSTRRWLEQDISAPGVAHDRRACSPPIDPGRNFNPGKITPN